MPVIAETRTMTCTVAKCTVCGDLNWSQLPSHGKCSGQATMTKEGDLQISRGEAVNLLDTTLHLKDVMLHKQHVDRAGKVFFGKTFPQHDLSKFHPEEAIPYMLKMFCRCNTETFMPAVQHHYANNRHHVQHHKDAAPAEYDLEETLADQASMIFGRETLQGKPNPNFGCTPMQALDIVEREIADTNHFVHKQMGKNVAPLLAIIKSIKGRTTKVQTIPATYQCGHCPLKCNSATKLQRHALSAHNIECCFCGSANHTDECETKALFGCSSCVFKSDIPSKALNHASNAHAHGTAHVVAASLETQSDTRGPPVQEVIETGTRAAYTGSTIPALANGMAGWTQNVPELAHTYQELERGSITSVDATGDILFEASYGQYNKLNPYCKIMHSFHLQQFGEHQYKILVYGASVQSGSLLIGVIPPGPLPPTTPAELQQYDNVKRISFNMQGFVEVSLGFSAWTLKVNQATTGTTMDNLHQRVIVMIDELPTNTIGLGDTTVRYTIFHRMAPGGGYNFPKVSAVNSYELTEPTDTKLNEGADIDLGAYIDGPTAHLIVDGDLVSRLDARPTGVASSHNIRPNYMCGTREVNYTGSGNASRGGNLYNVAADATKTITRSTGTITEDNSINNEFYGAPQKTQLEYGGDYVATIAQADERVLTVHGFGRNVCGLWTQEIVDDDIGQAIDPSTWSMTISAFDLKNPDTYVKHLVPGQTLQLSPPRSDYFFVNDAISDHLPVTGETPWTANLIKRLNATYPSNAVFTLRSQGETIGEIYFDKTKQVLIANSGVNYGHLALPTEGLVLAAGRSVTKQYFPRRWPAIVTGRGITPQAASLSAMAAAAAIGAASDASNLLISGGQRRRTQKRHQDFLGDQAELSREFQSSMLTKGTVLDFGADYGMLRAKAEAINTTMINKMAASNANLSTTKAPSATAGTGTYGGGDSDTDYYSVAGSDDEGGAPEHPKAEPGDKILTGRSSGWTSQGTEQVNSKTATRSFQPEVSNYSKVQRPIQMKDAEVTADPDNKKSYAYNAGDNDATPSHAWKEYPSESGPGQMATLNTQGTQADFYTDPPATAEEAAAQTGAGLMPRQKTAFVS